MVLTEADLPFQGAALVVKDPYLTYARMAQILDTTPQPAKDIAPSAVIDAVLSWVNMYQLVQMPLSNLVL